jgi:NAD(P)-dependent dehydrogenase (short-subunit alcohol dehydrogenase family)
MSGWHLLIFNEPVGYGDAAMALANLKQVPSGRLGEPDEVACAIVRLAAAVRHFMSGVELELGAGNSARWGR